MLRLTFLGTGTSQGVPMIGCDCEVCRSGDRRDRRLRSSVMVEHIPERNGEKYGVPDSENGILTKKHDSYGKNCNGSNITLSEGGGDVSYLPDAADILRTYDSGVQERIIIDAGPDFRYQMLRENIGRIDAIVLTHEHKDHIAGLDDVRAFNYFQQQATAVYASERTARVVMKDFDYAFGEHKYPGAPEIELHTINSDTHFSIGNLTIIPVVGLHYKLPVLGFRIGRLAYLTDFNYIAQTEIEKLRGVELLVINALRHEKHLSHYTVGEAIEVGRQIGAHETYLTHASHQIGLWQQTERTLPEGFHLAYDGLKITV